MSLIANFKDTLWKDNLWFSWLLGQIVQHLVIAINFLSPPLKQKLVNSLYTNFCLSCGSVAYRVEKSKMETEKKKIWFTYCIDDTLIGLNQPECFDTKIVLGFEVTCILVLMQLQHFWNQLHWTFRCSYCKPFFGKNFMQFIGPVNVSKCFMYLIDSRLNLFFKMMCYAIKSHQLFQLPLIDVDALMLALFRPRLLIKAWAYCLWQTKAVSIMPTSNL